MMLIRSGVMSVRSGILARASAGRGAFASSRSRASARVCATGGAAAQSAGTGAPGRRLAAALTLGGACVSLRGGRAYAAAPSQPFDGLQYEEIKEGTGDEVVSGKGAPARARASPARRRRGGDVVGARAQRGGGRRD